MKLLALTGGIGSGKSSVSERLAQAGAVIVDADAIAKELQEPGRPVFEAMVERWGQGIVDDDGLLDRAAVANIVFGDDDELAALNGIVHPALWAEMANRVMAAAELDTADCHQVVILDMALLKEGGAEKRGASAVIVVDCPTDIAVDRLIQFRQFDRADAQARVASQITRDERLQLADFVVDNSGDLAALDAEVSRCQAWINELPPAKSPDQ